MVSRDMIEVFDTSIVNVKILNTKTGEIVAETHNLITIAGKYRVLDLFSGLSSSSFTYIAVGTGTTPPTELDLTLVSELGRQSSTSSRSSNTLTMQAIFTAGVATGTWNETGIFNAAVGGDMSHRAVFTVPVSKGATDVYTVIWTITI